MTQHTLTMKVTYTTYHHSQSRLDTEYVTNEVTRTIRDTLQRINSPAYDYDINVVVVGGGQMKCLRCNGRGMIPRPNHEWRWDDCPNCNGTGKVVGSNHNETFPDGTIEVVIYVNEITGTVEDMDDSSLLWPETRERIIIKRFDNSIKAREYFAGREADRGNSDWANWSIDIGEEGGTLKRRVSWRWINGVREPYPDSYLTDPLSNDEAVVLLPPTGPESVHESWDVSAGGC